MLALRSLARRNVASWLQMRSTMRFTSGIHISDEICEAMSNESSSKPVVALESTIISHGGFPYPSNYELGLNLEQIVRDNGGIPATCLIIDGQPIIGANKEQLKFISNASNSIVKVAQRDIPIALSRKHNASTTVSGTMALAQFAGIKFFATGGIGGVHRGAEYDFDISSDLTALSKINMMVVSAGIKSILDVRKTLEMLETLSVPILSYKSKGFPTFFTNDSSINNGFEYIENEDIAADVMIQNSEILKNENGILVAVPNPHPYADADKLEAVIQSALTEVSRQGILGAAVTPFVLQKVGELTGGDSREANVALVKNNVEVCTRIAKAYQKKLRRMNGNGNGGGKRTYHSFARKAFSSIASVRDMVIIIGAVAMDSISTIHANQTYLKSSNPGATVDSFGGVAGNIAYRLGPALRQYDNNSNGGRVAMASVVASDEAGQSLLKFLSNRGINTDNVIIPTINNTHGGKVNRTARYAAVHDQDGELIVAVSDFSILQQFQVQDALLKQISSSFLVAMDGNFSPSVFSTIANTCAASKTHFFFEPTSDHKCKLPVMSKTLHCLDILKPNLTELIVMLEAALQVEIYSTMMSMEEKENIVRSIALINNVREQTAFTHVNILEVICIETIQALSRTMLKLISSSSSSSSSSTVVKKEKHIIVSLSEHGVVWTSEGQSEHLAIPSQWRASEEEINKHNLNTNGSGDSFVAGLVAYMVMHQSTVTKEGISMGFEHAIDHIRNGEQ